MGLPFVAALALYLAGFAFFAYGCVIADPSTSSISRALTGSLPRFLGGKLRLIVGPRLFGYLEDAAQYTLVLVYLLLVLGCWSVMFTHGYDMIARSERVSNVHKYLGYATFAACMSSWRCASRTSPGVITSRTMARYDHFPYDDLLFTDRICPTVKIRKLARSKYDRATGRHIPRFDHYCGWINQPIGEENYRYFMAFLVVHAAMCAYGTCVTSELFWGEIVDSDLFNATFFVVETGEEVKATKIVVGQYLLSKHFYLASVLVVMAVMGAVLIGFLGFHLYITARGMTTNEYYKWREVRRWHRRAKARYEEATRESGSAVASGDGSRANVVVVSDESDVGCAGPTGTNGATPPPRSEGSRREGKEEERVLDPGPFPRNVYDRGVYENFREVIFPRSLRGDAFQRWEDALRKEGGERSAGGEYEAAAAMGKPKAT